MFDLDPASLILSLVMSTIAIGYYSYGKKRSPYFKMCGALLLLITFVISDFWTVMGLGVVLLILPFILERMSK